MEKFNTNTLEKIKTEAIPDMIAQLQQDIIHLDKKYPDNGDASHIVDLKAEIIGILEDEEANKEERIADIQGKIMEAAVKLG